MLWLHDNQVAILRRMMYEYKYSLNFIILYAQYKIETKDLFKRSETIANNCNKNKLCDVLYFFQ
jgi:hypothetical protein